VFNSDREGRSTSYLRKKVYFTSGLKYNDKQELYRPVYPGIPQYVGEPSPELDTAWENLLGGKFTAQEFSQHQSNSMNSC